MGEASSIPVKCFASAVLRAVGQHMQDRASSRLSYAVLKLRDPCLHGVDTGLRVEQLFLVVLCRMRVASDLMSPHLRQEL